MSALTAARIPADESVSGWYAILPQPPAPRVLEGEIAADWAVVGAGFAGVAAARRLTQLQPGAKVVLLEAQRLAWGANGRNTGFMIDLPHELNSERYTGARARDRQQIRLNRAGIDYARETASALGLEGVISPSGKVHGATDGAAARALAEYSAHLDALGEPYRTLSADDLADVLGTGYYVGGIHTPGACLMQPAAYIRGVAEGLRREAGVETYEDSPLIKLETDGARPVLTTPKGRITAGGVVLTVNGHIESLGLYKRRLLHVFTYASMTRPLDAAERAALGGRDEWGLIPADPMGTTLRRTRDHRIVVRNTFTYNPSMATSARQIARIARAHDRSFRARFPRLRDVEMPYRWGGHLCLALNSVPVFGEVRPKVFAACCQNGLGTVKGTLNGKLAADLAAGGTDPMLAEWQAFDDPARLYPEPFTTLGARAKLWWMHKRAGTDF